MALQARPLTAGGSRSSGGSRRPLPRNLREPDRRLPTKEAWGRSGLEAIKNFFPGVANMVGAVVSDIPGRLGRGLTPGGEGFFGPVRSWDAIIKPVGQSFGNVGATLAASLVAPAPRRQEWAEERIASQGEQMREDPVGVLLEGLGTAAIGGGVAAKPLAAGARTAARVPKPTRKTLRAAGVTPSGKNVRAARRTQLQEIAEGGGPGAGLARGSIGARDVVGRPIITMAKGAADVRLPKLVGGSHTLREVGQQFRASAPVRMEGGRAVPRDITDPSSPLARRLRTIAETPQGQGLREFMGPVKLQASSLVNDYHTQRQRLGSNLRSRWTPEGRRADFTRTITQARKYGTPEMKAAFGNAAFDVAVGRTGLPRHPDAILKNPEHATAMRDALAAIPEGALPASLLKGKRESLVLDLEDAAQGLAPGTTASRLTHDIPMQQQHPKTGLPQAEALRIAQAALREKGVADLEGVGGLIPVGPNETALSPAARAAARNVVESRTTGEARIERELALAESGALAERMAPVVVPDPAAPGGYRQPTPEEAAARAAQHTITPSESQAKALTDLEGRVRDAIKAVGKAEQRVVDTHAAGRVSARAQFKDAGRQIDKLARELRKPKLDPAVREGLRAQLQTARATLDDIAQSAGTRLPDQVGKSHDRLLEQLDLEKAQRADAQDALLQIDDRVIRKGDDFWDDPVEAELLGVRLDKDGRAVGLTGWERTGKFPKDKIVPAARRAEQTRRTFQEKLANLEERGAVNLGKLHEAQQRQVHVEALLEDAFTELHTSLAAAPPAARPTLEATRRAGDLMDQLMRSTGLDELADQLDLRGYARTAQELTDRGATAGFLRLTYDQDARVQDLYRRGAVQPGRLEQQMQRRDTAAGDIVTDFDEVALAQDYGLYVAKLQDDYLAEATRRFGHNPDELAAHYAKMDPDAWANISERRKAELLREQGMVEWRPADPRDPLRFNDSVASPESVWVHESLGRALVDYQSKNLFTTVNQMIVNPVMRGWKAAVLASRPAWHINNAIGNMTMSMIHGGVDPITYLTTMAGPAREAIARYQLGVDPVPGRLSYDTADNLIQTRVSQMYDDAAGVDPNVSGRMPGDENAGIGAAITKKLEAGGATYQRARRLTGRGITASYRANNYVDNLNRITVFLANVDNLGQQGALRLAMEALGDYSKMTPFERQYVRSIFPFWAWQRHIMTLTARQFSPEHMTRTAMGLHLTNLATDQDEWRHLLAPYEGGAVMLPGGDNLLSTRAMNPFADAFGMVMTAEGDIAPWRAGSTQTGPLPGFLQERMTGVSTFTGRPFTQAIPEEDIWGREKLEPPPLGEHLFGAFAPPQLRTARDLTRRALGRTTARYDSGEPVLWEDAHTRRPWEQPLAMLGASVTKANLEGRTEAQAKAAARLQGRRLRRQQQEEEYQRRQPALSRLLPGD